MSGTGHPHSGATNKARQHPCSNLLISSAKPEDLRPDKQNRAHVRKEPRMPAVQSPQLQGILQSEAMRLCQKGQNLSQEKKPDKIKRGRREVDPMVKTCHPFSSLPRTDLTGFA
jgi:hypothetical protein